MFPYPSCLHQRDIASYSSSPFNPPQPPASPYDISIRDYLIMKGRTDVKWCFQHLLCQLKRLLLLMVSWYHSPCTVGRVSQVCYMASLADTDSELVLPLPVQVMHWGSYQDNIVYGLWEDTVRICHSSQHCDLGSKRQGTKLADGSHQLAWLSV